MVEDVGRGPKMCGCLNSMALALKCINITKQENDQLENTELKKKQRKLGPMLFRQLADDPDQGAILIFQSLVLGFEIFQILKQNFR